MRLALLLGPALILIVALYLGGLALALLQSLGYLPEAGLTHISLAAYSALFERPDFFGSLFLTLWVSLASTALSIFLAIGGALLLRSLLDSMPGGRR
jgi:putative spermidine/putrescine transport system permease protein